MKKHLFCSVFHFCAALFLSASASAQVAATGSVTNVHCFGDSTGSISYQINGGPGPVHYVWNNGDSGVSVGGCTYIVHITNTGPLLTRFQVRVPVTHVPGMNANFSNVSFTDTLGHLLPFWLVDFPSPTQGIFWVRVPSLPTGVTNIYLTFCDTSSVSLENADSTFEFFDNFDHGTFSSWTQACITPMAGSSCAAAADNTIFWSPGYSAHLSAASTCFTPPYSGAGSTISYTVNPIVNDSLVLDYEDRVAATLWGFCSGGTGTRASAQDNSVSIGNGQGINQGGTCGTNTSNWAAETSQPFVVSTATTTITLEEHGGDCDNSDGWFDDVRIRKYRSNPPTVVIDTTPRLRLDSLGAGTYIITMTASNGSVYRDSFVVTQPAAVAPVPDSINIACFGQSTGAAWVTTPVGGTPRAQYPYYSFQWSTTATSDTLLNLAPGSYQVTVTDSFGCRGTAAVQIVQPAAALAVTSDSLNIPCFGQTNGRAWAIVNGGTPLYTYAWSGSAQTTDTITGLSANTYTVTVSDANLCTASASINITQPPLPLSLKMDSMNILCFGQMTGKAIVTASGGTMGYAYQWNNAATSDTLQSLAAGVYYVTVTDTMGCTATGSVNVIQPNAALSLQLSHRDITCRGLQDGEAAVSPSGGTAAYSYLWNNGSTLDSINLLDAGGDSVTVTDANGCTATAYVTIAPSADSVRLDSAASPAICGEQNGWVKVIALGGSGSYQYLWSTAGTQDTTAGLGAGTYFVTVTDNTGCSAARSVSIAQYPALEVTPASGDDTCNHKKGFAAVSVTSGTPPYTFAWTPAGINPSSLDSGTYTVLITDSTGCTTTSTIVVHNINDNCSSILIFPTAFSPNNDGRNDVFRAVYTPDLSTFHMRIYDRWGQVVFETSEMTEGWNGKYIGVDQPVGTYIWKVEYRFKNQMEESQSGNITLIR